MSLAFHTCAKCTDEITRYILCAPLAACGWRGTYPDDPWFSDPEDGVEIFYHIERMDISYHPGDEDSPALALDFVEKHVTTLGGRVFVTCPSVIPPFCCHRWNVVRQATAHSNGTLHLYVLPGHLDEVLEIMENLTDFRGRPIPAVRESKPITDHEHDEIVEDTKVDVVAVQGGRKSAVPMAHSQPAQVMASPEAVTVEERE
eukprot:CAMPEP_0118852778 /NCGR_PEP_ID=MMETSP1163-20130328/1633_1 /TAXON_ID=124430 /ORGANISM="Phaeomonas parva, Strain CCMP2877" /LENGTH=201 /DNA_ID=CAMNT_0006785243 /DNA_START=200 /DNA_END=805 /DNA_ORIENTATION=-